MEDIHIFEGRTTTEAINLGLKELHTTRENVEIKILEEENKRSFFSILAPRVVKVEMKLKNRVRKEEKPKINIDIDFETAKNNINRFFEEWLQTLPTKGIEYKILEDGQYLMIDINGEDINYLIGYRGDVLNNLQDIFSVVASKGLNYKVKVILNICGYKEKRKKDLEELAEKLSKTVIRNRKSITLEPMTAYERKIIHSKLQDSDKVITTSVGEEPYRKVVISLK